MSRTTIWLLVLFTLCFICGVNIGEISILLNNATSICLSCIGVG